MGVIILAAAMALAAGCQQQQQATPSEKQARLLAAQSADLQKQLTAAREEIEALRRTQEKELLQRDEELAECRARIDVLQKDIKKGIAERASSVAATVMQENAKLRQENEQLKAEIEKLKAASAQENVP